MTTPTEQALASFDSGCNCAQAVLLAFASELGLSPDLAIKIAAGFGGGLGRSGETCGALSGAIMVIGLKTAASDITDIAAKEKAYALTLQLVTEFKERQGSVQCRELIGFDLSQPEELNQARHNQVFRTRCPQFVHDAAEIVSALLDEQP